eukprot:754261-Hanusia_phi.AAC.5
MASSPLPRGGPRRGNCLRTDLAVSADSWPLQSLQGRFCHRKSSMKVPETSTFGYDLFLPRTVPSDRRPSGRAERPPKRGDEQIRGRVGPSPVDEI